MICEDRFETQTFAQNGLHFAGYRDYLQLLGWFWPSPLYQNSERQHNRTVFGSLPQAIDGEKSCSLKRLRLRIDGCSHGENRKNFENCAAAPAIICFISRWFSRR